MAIIKKIYKHKRWREVGEGRTLLLKGWNGTITAIMWIEQHNFLKLNKIVYYMTQQLLMNSQIPCV